VKELIASCEPKWEREHVSFRAQVSTVTPVHPSILCGLLIQDEQESPHSRSCWPF